MMPVNLLVSMVFSLHCISNGKFASCICIGDLLLLFACVGSWSCPETLEVGVLKAGTYHVPCHYDVAVSICSVHILHIHFSDGAQNSIF